MTTAGSMEAVRSRAAWQTAIVIGLAGAVAAALLGDLYTAAVAMTFALVGVGLALVPLARSLPLLLFFIPLRMYIDVPGTGIEIALTNFIFVGLGVMCLASVLLRGRPRLVGWELVVAGWVLWTMASLAWTPEFVASLRGVFRWMMFFSAILLSAQCLLRAANPAGAVRRLLIALLCLVGACSVVGFVQVALGLDPIITFLGSPGAAVFFPPLFLEERLASLNFNWRVGTDVQPFGPFLNAIEFGILTAVGVGTALALAVGRSRLAPRSLVLGVLILASAANIACMKGTGWVAASVAVAIAFVSLGRSIRRVVGVSLLTLAVLGVIVYLFRDTLAQRIQDLAAREGTQGATAEALSRPAIWLFYLNALFIHPMVGGGVNTAALYGPIHWTRAPGGSTSVAVTMPTENSYLTTAIEIGLVGLGLLLLTLVGALVRGLRLARRFPDHPLAQAAGTAAIGLAAILAGNLTVDAFSGEIMGVVMGILVGIIVAANRLLPGSSSVP